MKKAVYYINQFFAQIGGEEKADTPLHIQTDLIGNAQAFAQALDGQLNIAHLIYCGDTYFSFHFF